MHRRGHGVTDSKIGADLVFDFSEMERPDLGGMALVLTARQLAEEDDRRVWVRAMSARMHELLYALGLENLFEVLPRSGDYDD